MKAYHMTALHVYRGIRLEPLTYSGLEGANQEGVSVPIRRREERCVPSC